MVSSQNNHQKNINSITEKNRTNHQTDTNENPLENLGFDAWFASQSEDYAKENFSLARIIEVNKGNYKISDGLGEFIAELSGKFLFNAEKSMDYPTVGDWVAVQCFDSDSLAIIHAVLPRKSLLKRKDPGKIVDFQLIAANIDYAFILQSADANFNLNRLERYFVMISESKIQPIVVLSKTDLISDDELAEINDRIQRFNDKYLFLPISSVTEAGIASLNAQLQPGKTYCLLGSSGVGKTTLLNKLLGEQMFDVKEVRDKDSKGRHTTARRQLIRLQSGSIFIDTPGMRELGNFAIEAGLDETFDEIISYSKQCRFNDCTHINETGCAVIEAVEQGLVDENRYHNYLKIQKESAHYAMSYSEKRKKDKKISKMVKNYKKTVRKK